MTELRAGGTDLSERRRSGVSTGPIADIAYRPDLLRIDRAAGGSTRIGALVPIATVAGLGADYPGLAAAAGGLATPQIRRIGTVGGNLLQRNRCWYYRNPGANCLKKGGHDCPARAGNHRYHVLFDLGPCVAPHPSTLGAALLAYGATVDDLGDHRPGMTAARQRGVRAPLIDAGLGKAEIRDLSRAFDLPTWDKPAMACLSSRFPYGTPITAEKLRQVDRAEATVRALGFREFRVRHHGEIARLEIARDEMARLWEEGRAEAIVERLGELGFIHVTLDLRGFRSGSLNEALLRLRARRKSGADPS